ncbi:MAG: hypothetical protein R8J41_00375 [Alphaproteobacteria bacterium]|nr:hypothetical protein [Alphaproteobacteria bacterium]
MIRQAPTERDPRQAVALETVRVLDGLIALTQQTGPSQLLTELLILAKSEAERQNQDSL